MKKVLSVLLCGMIFCGMAGCSSSEEPKTTTSNTTSIITSDNSTESVSSSNVSSNLESVDVPLSDINFKTWDTWGTISFELPEDWTVSGELDSSTFISPVKSIEDLISVSFTITDNITDDFGDASDFEKFSKTLKTLETVGRIVSEPKLLEVSGHPACEFIYIDKDSMSTDYGSTFLNHHSISITAGERLYIFYFVTSAGSYDSHRELIEYIISSIEITDEISTAPSGITEEPAATIDVEPEPTPEPTPPVSWHGASMYKIGTDLPAGEYYLECTGSAKAYMSVYSDSAGKDILTNDNFQNHIFTTVSEGQYFELKRGRLISINEYTPEFDSSSLPEGMYRVGIDIPAGEYTLTNNSAYKGYYAVFTDSSASKDIISNNNFEGNNYVTVSDGQYLYTSRCTATFIS